MDQVQTVQGICSTYEKNNLLSALTEDLQTTLEPFLSSQAIGWVDESILAEAHKRLPPPNLYYPVDTEASRQGRWLEQTGEALEECGYAYFLKTETTKSQEEDKENYKDNTPNQELKASIFKPFSSVENYIIDAQEAKTEISASQAPQSLGKSKAGRSLTCGRPGAASRHDETADRDVVEQWHGLRRELKRAIREARTIFKEGDRVESRWRRPTRLDKPRVDRGTWHPGYIVTANKDGKVELVFEDGEEEHLNAVPAKHVRLAPSPEYSKCPDVTSSQKQIDTSSSVDLCSASRRELSHIVSATKILRRTWDNPLRMDQELARLRGLWEEKMRSRPEWRVSFPAVSFETTKRLPIASGVAGGFCQSRDGKQRQHPKVANRRSKKRSQTSLSISGTPPELAETNEEDQRHNEVDHHGNTWDTLGITSSLRLIEAQSNLVAAAMAYDKCVAELRNTLDRGVSTFRAARTYSEQQSAFAEATAALGPSQPAQAGYSDWRGRRVVGLQSATLDAVEALDAWAVEWKAAKDEAAGADFHNVVGQSGTDGINAVVEAPPFLWEGSPLASTIIGHSAAILSRAPELKGWYGPGFPARTNPFFLAYPIEGRPVTPRNALVQAYVNGEVHGWLRVNLGSGLIKGLVLFSKRAWLSQHGHKPDTTENATAWSGSVGAPVTMV